MLQALYFILLALEQRHKGAEELVEVVRSALGQFVSACDANGREFNGFQFLFHARTHRLRKRDSFVATYGYFPLSKYQK
ncbi:hypothetical protein [Prosthecobacter fluviatilis]|uniref:Uncharacterized protein n=1 Tax=Prosthecobacter fluviatilis TaxID=445931 RepID=A0ABW0KP88_9BACT